MKDFKYKNTLSRTLLSYSDKFIRSEYMNNLTKRETNLLYGILSVLKTEDIITLKLRDLTYFIYGNKKKQSTTDTHNTINRLVEKIDTHKITIKGEDSETLIPLFSIINKEYKKGTKHIKTLSLKVNKEAQKLFNVLLEKNFTQIDINDIRHLNSKYSITMYEYCSKFSSTGIVKIKYEDFLNKLSVPNNYYKSQVKSRVIQPIIKDLSKVFHNFKLELVEEYCRGRMIPTYISIKFSKFKLIPVDKIDTKKKKEIKRYELLKIVDKEIDKEIKDEFNNSKNFNIEEYKKVKDFVVRTLNKESGRERYFKIQKYLKNLKIDLTKQ